jgi:hypothetical protein
MASWPQNPSDFAERRLVRSHISQTEGDRHNIEPLVQKWQRQSVCDHQLLDTTPAGNSQHWRTKIRSDDPRARDLPLDFMGQDSATSGQIQDISGSPSAHPGSNICSPKGVAT